MLECQSMIEPQAQKRGIRLTFSPLRRFLASSSPTRPVKQISSTFFQRDQIQPRQGTVVVECAASPGRIRYQRQGHRRRIGSGASWRSFQAVQFVIGQEASAEEWHLESACRHQAGGPS